MSFFDTKRDFKEFEKCHKAQQESFLNLSKETTQSEDICEILVTQSDFIVGGFIVKDISKFKVFSIKELVINPKLKSSKYTQEIIDRIIQIGCKIHPDFRGVVFTTYLTKKQKQKTIEADLLIYGDKLIIQSTENKNIYVRCIYMPYGGGYQSNEIKEIFKEIL